jgi:flagellar biosynthesis chaperone FliJ
MGMGATNTLARLGASIGLDDGVELDFQDCSDVPNGGVLLGLPALLSQGLLYKIGDHFQLPKGYYQLSSIFLLLAFMTLTRVKFVESLKYTSPGEWGNLLGLDRSPESRTLRKKIKHLSEDGNPILWSADLCKGWMLNTPAESGVLYIDGHVRVYHGSQTKLPRHYIARDKLCARATCDYWVNAMNGNPFFYVNKAVDPGLLQVLEHEIIPRLEQDVPNQPTAEELKMNPRLCRFTIVFDREGYSPAFVARMWKKRIAVTTYIKKPGEDWPKEEFTLYKAKLNSGESLDLWLAERGTIIDWENARGSSKRNSLWVREVRRLRDNRAQGSIVSTNFNSDIISSYVRIISRWSQENFFAYARREFNLDRLIDYGLEPVSDTIKLINPKYRELDSEIRKLNSLLNRKKALLGNASMDEGIEPANVEKYERKISELTDEINALKIQISQKKEMRKSHPKHILFENLPEEYKFEQLRTKSKHLIDTIKMISYRAETAMASIVREKIPTHDSGVTRVLLREIYNSMTDMKVNREEKTLTIYLHHLANHSSDNAARHLCKELTETETIFPGTEYRLIYEVLE